MGDRALEFAIFAIENTAQKLNVPGNVVYDALTKQSDILYSYLIPSYDVLHTQDKEYIVRDLIEVMEKKGVVL